MIVIRTKTGRFSLRGMTAEDVQDMITMIEGACLPQRRVFDNLKNDLKNELSRR